MNNRNIHLMPTDKASRLHIWINDKGLQATLYEESQADYRSGRYIYITNDEKIKEGWGCYPNKPNPSIECLKNNGTNYSKEYGWGKIILTNDSDLIKDGVQAIDDEFLEWFVKNSSCESVEFDIFPDLQSWNESTNKCNNIYKIIIPKEKSKSETLEEAADKFFNDGKQGLLMKAIFIKGAKWQAERMYTEEEVLKMFKYFDMDLPLHYELLVKEQFKKKL